MCSVPSDAPLPDGRTGRVGKAPSNNSRWLRFHGARDQTGSRRQPGAVDVAYGHQAGIIGACARLATTDNSGQMVRAAISSESRDVHCAFGFLGSDGHHFADCRISQRTGFDAQFRGGLALRPLSVLAGERSQISLLALASHGDPGQDTASTGRSRYLSSMSLQDLSCGPIFGLNRLAHS